MELIKEHTQTHTHTYIYIYKQKVSLVTCAWEDERKKSMMIINLGARFKSLIGQLEGNFNFVNC